MVRTIGADHTIDYTQQDFTKGNAEYDLILGDVGAHPLSAMRGVLTTGGLLLANGAPAPAWWFGGLGHPLKGKASSLFNSRQGRPFLSVENPEDLNTLQQLATQGSITPVIDEVFPFERAVDAVRFVGDGHNPGTSVITV